MYQLKHDILFISASKKKFKLRLLNSVKVVSSVKNLVDTAIIVMPESVMNDVLKLENKITTGDEVTIKLGYNDDFKTEFIGYIKDIENVNGTLNINCEDALYVFRKQIADKIFKPGAVKDILNYLINEVDSSYSLVMDADYGITYKKFIIHKAEAYDVLKKLQQELKANIYFNTEKKELHFHAPYKDKGGEVKYDMSVNVETSSLKFKKASDEKLEVVIQSTSVDGTIHEVKVGTTGGKQVKMKVGAMSVADMKKIANNVLNSRNSDRYEGSIDTWLIPFCQPTYSAEFRDADYKDRNGNYYVESVTTSFSDAGGKRTIDFGKKL